MANEQNRWSKSTRKMISGILIGLLILGTIFVFTEQWPWVQAAENFVLRNLRPVWEWAQGNALDATVLAVLAFASGWVFSVAGRHTSFWVGLIFVAGITFLPLIPTITAFFDHEFVLPNLGVRFWLMLTAMGTYFISFFFWEVQEFTFK